MRSISTTEGFEWIDFSDYERSIVSFVRRAKNPDDFLVFVFNFTPVPRYNYRVGVPKWGFYREILNSDSALYWGSNMGNQGGRHTDPVPWHGRPCSLSLDLPPLGAPRAQARLIAVADHFALASVFFCKKASHAARPCLVARDALPCLTSRLHADHPPLSSRDARPSSRAVRAAMPRRYLAHFL